MPQLPQRYAPYLFAAIQAAITTAVATAIATLQFTGFDARFLLQWGLSWLESWALMLPIVLGMDPVIQRVVHFLIVKRA